MYQNLLPRFHHFCRFDRLKRVTRLQLQYDQLNKVPPTLCETNKANKPSNQNLNNDGTVLPCTFYVASLNHIAGKVFFWNTNANKLNVSKLRSFVSYHFV